MSVIEAMTPDRIIPRYIGWDPGTQEHVICPDCHEPVMTVCALLKFGETATVHICECRLSPNQLLDRRLRQHNRDLDTVIGELDGE